MRCVVLPPQAYQVRAVRSDDGQVIATRSAQAAQAHIDELQGGVLAIQTASREVAETLLSDILQRWQGEGHSGFQQITLIVSGLVSYRHLSAVQQFLTSSPRGGAGRPPATVYAEGTAELTLDYAGVASRIAEELATRRFPGYRLEPTNVTPNRLDVRAVLDR